jgi:PPOX class probable F420-dependent enzyme
MAEIPADITDLFERRTIAHVATVLPDGTPHVVPVWIDYDGTHLLVNTPQGSRKARNVLRDPHVAVSMVDPENPYRQLLVRGEVVEATADGAADHIDHLAKRYAGTQSYGGPRRDRLLLKIRPDHVSASAPPARA